LRAHLNSHTEHQSIDHSEIDSQAKNIRSKLKQLKKETEYAKKLILNEKKLDHLLGVLDKSRESIIKQSISAFDDNQQIIQHHEQNSYRMLQHKMEGESSRISKPPKSSFPKQRVRESVEERLAFSNQQKEQYKNRIFAEQQELHKRKSEKKRKSKANISGLS